MAIIAILATAGLSAYTGYIKKARDTTRIADLAAINTIVMASMSSTGMPPQTTLEVIKAIVAANNGTMIDDPLMTTVSGVRVPATACLNSTGLLSNGTCEYAYYLCDSGLGYALATRFESKSNLSLYDSDAISSGISGPWVDNTLYEVGSCKTVWLGAPNGLNSPLILRCTDSTCTESTYLILPTMSTY